MDIRSVGNTPQSGQLISDRISTADASAAVSPQPSAPVQTVDAVKQTSAATSPQELENVTKAVDDINKSIKNLAGNLEFSIDDTSKKVIVKVVDQQTKQVLTQIPSQEAIDISRSLDKLQGLLIHHQA
ncbi:MAG: flagellar protein FlaG [Burkholderiales bacterium]|nr:flagellar protein FlaG [Burkholderiales bacterium]